jgi:Dynamin central region
MPTACPRVQGKGGGERVLQVFEEALPSAMNAQPFTQLLSIQSVKRIIQDSDGYQPFLVAPENGYRALVREGVKLMEPPSAAAVDQVDMVLRDVGQKARRLRTVACTACCCTMRAGRRCPMCVELAWLGCHFALHFALLCVA